MRAVVGVLSFVVVVVVVVVVVLVSALGLLVCHLKRESSLSHENNSS